MTLSIPDDILTSAHLNEHELIVEIACHLFDKERLSLGQASRLAGMNRTEFEEALFLRKIPAYHYDEKDFESDMRTLDAADQPEN